MSDCDAIAKCHASKVFHRMVRQAASDLADVQIRAERAEDAVNGVTRNSGKGGVK